MPEKKPADRRPRSPPTSRPASGDWAWSGLDPSGSSTVTSPALRSSPSPSGTWPRRTARESSRGWGVSNWTVARIEALQAVAGAEGLPPMTSQPPLLPRRLGAPSLGRVGEHRWTGRTRGARLPTRGPGSRCWRGHTLGSGFLTSGEAGRVCYGSPANVARRERARALARERGWTAAELALAYLFSQPFPVSAVVAASTGEKMPENVAAVSFRLHRPARSRRSRDRRGPWRSGTPSSWAPGRRGLGGAEAYPCGSLGAGSSRRARRLTRRRDHGSFASNAARQLYRHLVSHRQDVQKSHMHLVGHQPGLLRGRRG